MAKLFSLLLILQILCVIFTANTTNATSTPSFKNSTTNLQQRANITGPAQNQCTIDADCGHGECRQNTCYCKLGFIDYTDKNGLYLRCSYEQKTQLKAFLFELLFNFGAGHFYLNRNKIGFLKLTAFAFGLLLICLFPLTVKFLNDKLESDGVIVVTSCIYYYYAIGLAVWYIYDLVLFGMNGYNDNNGMPLLKWGN